MSVRTYYSRTLVAEAERGLEFHADDGTGWCKGCGLVGIRVRAGECKGALWANSILAKVEAYGEPPR